MTVIVALKDPEHKSIILGTDTQVTSGQIMHESNGKIITLPLVEVDGFDKTINEKEIIIATCGRSYFKNFINYGFNVPNKPVNMSFIEYLHKEFLPKLSKEVREMKLIQEDSNQNDSEVSMLIIFKDELYHIEPNFGSKICLHN